MSRIIIPGLVAVRSSLHTHEDTPPYCYRGQHCDDVIGAISILMSAGIARFAVDGVDCPPPELAVSGCEDCLGTSYEAFRDPDGSTIIETCDCVALERSGIDG